MSDRVHDLYREHLGDEALERQRQAARDYWPCCGEHRTGPHNEGCAKFVPVELPPVHENQESLL